MHWIPTTGRAMCISWTLALVAAAGVAGASGQHRFTGSLRGIQGQAHEFFVGNGLTATFRDGGASNTRYRLCLRRMDATGRPTCRSSKTGTAGKRSNLFLVAPSGIGDYVAVWTVRGHAVAKWTFTNGPGD